MEIRNVEDGFKFRLLRKIPPNKDKSKKSLEIAKSRLKTSEEIFKAGIFSHVVLEAYTAMFHAARALLYKDGIQEKSHFAVYIYLKETYSHKIPVHIINFLNIHRNERHEALYGLDYQPEKEDAVIALQDARTFVQEIEKVM